MRTIDVEHITQAIAKMKLNYKEKKATSEKFVYYPVDRG